MKEFTNSEKEVISAMYQLDRKATAYEIANWAGISWNTTKKVLISLRRRKIVKPRISDGKKYWVLEKIN